MYDLAYDNAYEVKLGCLDWRKYYAMIKMQQQTTALLGFNKFIYIASNVFVIRDLRLCITQFNHTNSSVFSRHILDH